MKRPVLSNLGFVLQLAGTLMILPIIAGFIFNETDALISYFLTTVSFFIIGFSFNAFSKREELDLKSSAILITSVFFTLGLIGSIPYIYLEIFPGSIIEQFTNSYYESMSGYTTAGSTIIDDIDLLPKSLVLYRSLTQWIGGVGIIFILLAFFYPNDKKINGMSRIFGLDKIIIGIRLVLSNVLLVYILYAIILISVIYLLGFTNLLDSLSLILSSLSTGGLSPITDFYKFTDSPLFIFITIAMFLGSLNFFIHNKLINAKISGIFKTEFIIFCVIILVGIFLFYLVSGETIKDSLFTVISSSTTSGYSSINIFELNDASKLIIMALMFMGGMTFSTSGGIKIFRVIMFFKMVPWVIKKLVNDEKRQIKHDGDVIDVKEVNIFMILPGIILFLLFISVSIFVVHGFSFENAVFESISTYSLTGFSTGQINLETPLTLKWWIMLLFVIGRVEIIAFLIIFLRRKNNN